jgi:hypothetical protein
MCGASYAPPLVAGAIGLLIAAAPKLTPVQAMAALRATAVPVHGIAGGRIDVVAAARALGIIAAPKVAKTPTTTSETGRQLQIASGKFSRTLQKQLQLGAGPLTILLTRQNASTCTMALRSTTGLYLGWRTTATQIDLSDTVPRGTYTLSIACRDAHVRPYSLAIQTLLPTSS